MYPSYKNISEKERKRQELLKSVEKRLNDDRAKERAYAEAIWASDVEANNIKLFGSRTTNGTQTTSSSFGQSTPSGTNSFFSSPPDPDATGGPSSSNFYPTIGSLEPTSVGDSTDYTRLDETATQASINQPSTRQSRVLSDVYNVVDIGDVGDSVSDIDENEQQAQLGRTALWSTDEAMDTIEDVQRKSFEWVKEMFEKNSVLATYNISPIKHNGTIFDIYHLGLKEGDFHIIKQSGLPVRQDRFGELLDEIDWVATVKRIVDIAELRDLDLDRNEKLVYGNVERDAELAILNLYRKYPNEMKKIEYLEGIHPVEDVSNYSEPNTALGTDIFINSERTLKPDFDLNRVKILNKKGTHETQRMYRKVSWPLTLQIILENARELGLDIQDDGIVPKEWKGLKRTQPDTMNTSPDVIRERKAIKATRESGSDAINDNNLMAMVGVLLHDNASWIRGSNKFHPSTKNRNEVKINNNYYLLSDIDIDMEGGVRGQIIIKRTKGNREVKDQEYLGVLNSIDWAKSFDRLIEGIQKWLDMTDDAEEIRTINASLDKIKAMTRSFPEVSERDIHLFKGKTKGVNPPNLKNPYAPDIQLQGRGLVGGGIVRNLRNVEGSGTASDLMYKRLGSKYVKLPYLHQNKLKLTWANRTQVGKIRSISADLSDLIKELVFDGNVNQQIYDKLTVNDKRLFQEILQLTHLQHTFKTPLKDPLEELRAEFDKLRAQIALGNDNPTLIRELKALSLDLYSQKLISEQEFKDIFLQL